MYANKPRGAVELGRELARIEISKFLGIRVISVACGVSFAVEGRRHKRRAILTHFLNIAASNSLGMRILL
jgi:hypothetical protein